MTDCKVNDVEMEKTTPEEILFKRSANLFGLCPLERCHGVCRKPNAHNCLCYCKLGMNRWNMTETKYEAQHQKRLVALAKD